MNRKYINANLDLLLIDVFTLALVLIIFVFPSSPLRAMLGLAFITFFPGYTLLAALFSRKDTLSLTLRIALSLGFSLVIMVFIGLILNFTPWGIRLPSLLFAGALFILLASLLVLYVRNKIGYESCYVTNLKMPDVKIYTDFMNSGKLKHLAPAIILGVIIIGGSLFLGFSMARPVPQMAFTEFYILGADGGTENYPLELAPGKEGEVIVVIINREPAELDYRLEFRLNGITFSEIPSITLAPGMKWEQSLAFSISEAGDRQKMEFQLCQDGSQINQTRYLFVNVRDQEDN